MRDAMQQDLNDLYFFTQVVEKGGFAAAGRALSVPKSRLSRRVALLEESLGVRLLQRTSRNFAVTDIGQIYLRHCQAMLAEAQAAQDAIDHIQAEPRGQIRISCPVTLAQTLMAGIIAEFMVLYPFVSVLMDITNRRVDVIEEGFDLALRVRTVIEDSTLVMRSFGLSRVSLIASPALLDRIGPPDHPEDLLRFPSVSMILRDNRYFWQLNGPQGEECRIEHTPRLMADDFIVLREAAIAGIGLAAMPGYLCRDALFAGALVHVLPQWSFAPSNLHAVFPSRRGLVPAVRCLIDFLAKRLPEVASQYNVGDFLAVDINRGPL
jgi:DNA-binding transcriptional LysR family regulator